MPTRTPGNGPNSGTVSDDQTPPNASGGWPPAPNIAHDHGDETTAQAGAHEHGEEAGRRPTASSAPPFPRSPISSPASASRCCWSRRASLPAASASWRQGVFWGLAGFAVFTLAPGLGLATRASRHAGGRAWRAPAVVGGDGAVARQRRSPCWSTAARRSRSIAAVALLVAPHLDRRAAAGELRHADPRRPASQLRRRRGADHAGVLAAARRPGRLVPRTLHPRTADWQIATPPGRSC